MGDKKMNIELILNLMEQNHKNLSDIDCAAIHYDFYDEKEKKLKLNSGADLSTRLEWWNDLKNINSTDIMGKIGFKDNSYIDFTISVVKQEIKYVK